MASVSQKINDWVENNLITQEQGETIRTFEKSRKSVLTPLTILVFLGVLLIAAGIAAIVSSNWMTIPDNIKLGSMFILLVVVAFVTDWAHNKRPVIYEASILLNMLLFFAAIGLVGQVFHIKSDTYKAFLFWSALSFPLLFLTQKVFFGLLWMPIFVCSFSFSPLGEEVFKAIRNCFPSAIAFSFACFMVYVLTHTTKRAKVFTEPLKIFSSFGVLIPLLFTKWYVRELYAYAPFAFYFIGAIFVYILWYHLPLKKEEKKAALYTVLAYGIFLLLPMQEKFITFCAELIVLFTILFFVYQIRAERMAKAVTLFMALRIIAAFFDLFGTLLYTGLGFLSVGAVVLGVSFGWYKATQALKLRLKREE